MSTIKLGERTVSDLFQRNRLHLRRILLAEEALHIRRRSDDSRDLRDFVPLDFDAGDRQAGALHVLDG
jgi:hypothetical protein